MDLSRAGTVDVRCRECGERTFDPFDEEDSPYGQSYRGGFVCSPACEVADTLEHSGDPWLRAVVIRLAVEFDIADQVRLILATGDEGRATIQASILSSDQDSVTLEGEDGPARISWDRVLDAETPQ